MVSVEGLKDRIQKRQIQIDNLGKEIYDLVKLKSFHTEVLGKLVKDLKELECGGDRNHPKNQIL